MKKLVKKWGDSLVIVLDKEDIQIYELNEGDVIDIEIKKAEDEN